MKHMYLYKPLSLLMLFMAGIITAQAGTVTIDFTNASSLTVKKTPSSGGGEVEIVKDGITITSNLGRYVSNKYLLIGSTGNFDVSSSIGSMTRIVLTCEAGYANLDTYTKTNSTTLDLSLSAISSSATSDGGTRITRAVITYEDAKHTLSYSISPAATGSVVLGSTSVQEGQSTSITATPNSGYRFVSWSVTGTGSYITNTSEASTTFTMGTEDAIVTANFEAIPTYTISWSVNGTVVDTDVLEEGTAVTFNDAEVPTGCDKVFMGWVTTSSVDPNEEPTYVTSATATADIIYYAVFATESNAGVGTATLTASSSTWTGWADKELTDDKGNTWTGHCAGTEMGKDTKIYVIGLSTTAAPGSYLSSPTFPSNITSIKACIINPSGEHARTLNIKSSKDAVTNLGTITVPASEDGSHQLTATLGEDEFTKFYLTSEEVLQIRSITVNYGTISYSDYTTTATATVSLASACTDGSRYYGTYSCKGAFVVPADLTVSEISVADDKLTVADYDTGDIVPANTGVMISSTTSGNHTIVISDVAGTSVLGSSNMLRATGSTGITAEDMASADASSLFYRLTMHGGSTLGFYWGAADGGAFAVAAQKAYLAVPVSTARSISSFNLSDNGATIIKLITIPSAQEKTYNLRGQLITTSKGLVISKGKKIVNK